MSFTRTVESRAYDAHFDPTFTPAGAMGMDPRVAAAMSTANAVSGTTRFKYFRRPIMPHTNAIPPSILLAPTATTNPTIPLEDEPEPFTRTAEVQTMYRESEAQTNPYSPEYFLAPGARPEVLLLESLKANDGLPINNREIDMIGQARVKKDLELNALPMTDEACFVMRKKMMETQELRELKIKEADIDAKFEKRIHELKDALDERNETNDFLNSQRVESIRQARMEDREKAMQSIRKNRIQVLRRLARKRNEAEPLLSGTQGRDIINEYFDRGSTVYAPLKRDGASVISSKTTADVNSRTMPMNSMDVIAGVEAVVPNRLKAINNDIFDPEKKYLSSTLPVGISKGGGRAAKSRLTSSAMRAQRNTKIDIETMYDIIQAKKKKSASQPHISPVQRGNSANADGFAKAHGATTGAAEVLILDPGSPSDRPQTDPAKPASPTAAAAPGPRAGSSRKALASMLAGKPKGRPDTPDLASRTNAANTGHSLRVAVIMLQKLIRGRAVQNSMYEGRHRQKEVIEEMRAADDTTHTAQEEEQQLLYINQMKELRWKKLQQAMEDKVIGSLASNLLHFLEKEKERGSTIDDLVAEAAKAIHERSRREAAEAGRRQREGVPLECPAGLNGNVKSAAAAAASPKPTTASAPAGADVPAAAAAAPVSNNEEEGEAPSGNQAEEEAPPAGNNNQSEEEVS
jgi:hypothetical protein